MSTLANYLDYNHTKSLRFLRNDTLFIEMFSLSLSIQSSSANLRRSVGTPRGFVQGLRPQLVCRQ